MRKVKNNIRIRYFILKIQFLHLSIIKNKKV